jgi:diaminopimelate decarboxylase
MNDMMRPALYQAWMAVQPVTPREGKAHTWDLVGPICESGDWLARGRELAVEPGDLLAMMTAGAYAMTMASNYNTRGRPVEVLVDGDKVHLIRQRENPADLFALESLLK